MQYSITIKTLTKYILFLILSLALSTKLAFSKDKHNVTWVTEAFAPFYITDGENQGNGTVDKLIDLLEMEMRDFKHERQYVPILRIIQELKAKDQIACASFLYDPKTRDYAQYSQPLFVVPPQELIIRRSSWLSIGSPKTISLEKVLTSGEFSLGLGHGRNYGNKLTSIIEKFKQNNPKLYFRVGDHFNGLADMMILNRIDATIAYSGEVNYYLSEHDKSDALVHVPIEENNKALYVYIVMPKSEWGNTFLKLVNKAIHRVRVKPEYIKAIDEWFDHTADFDETLEELINYSKLYLNTEKQ